MVIMLLNAKGRPNEASKMPPNQVEKEKRTPKSKKK
jgi:hypothetical protein